MPWTARPGRSNARGEQIFFRGHTILLPLPLALLTRGVGDEERQREVLKCMKHTLTQQRKCCLAIHRALDQLELVDVTFHLPIGIDQR